MGLFSLSCILYIFLSSHIIRPFIMVITPECYIHQFIGTEHGPYHVINADDVFLEGHPDKRHEFDIMIFNRIFKNTKKPGYR